MPRKSNARQKIIESTKKLVEQQGARATTIDAVVQDSKAPRGSIYYYFKNGRTDMISDALGIADSDMIEMIHQSFDDQKNASTAVKNFFTNWGNYIQNNHFKNGCMATALAVEGDSIESELKESDSDVFNHWLSEISTSLQTYNLTNNRADSLASTILAAGEGAVILSRVAKNLTPFNQVSKEISKLLDDSCISSK